MGSNWIDPSFRKTSSTASRPPARGRAGARKCRATRKRRAASAVTSTWTACSVDGDGLELADLHALEQASDLPRLEAARAELERRGRAGGDRLAQRLLERAALVARREEGREQDVACADGGDRVDARRTA